MPHSTGYYSVAGVLVRTRPADLQAVSARLSACPGIEVHYQDADTGRLVITLETVNPDEEQAGIERVRGQYGVISVELVYHVVEPLSGDDEPAGVPERGAT